MRCSPFFRVGSVRQVRDVAAALLTAVVVTACAPDDGRLTAPDASSASLARGGTSFSPATLASGQRIFRYDTFGDESYWTDTLRMHEVIASSVSPTTR